jgi:MFS family permease
MQSFSHFPQQVRRAVRIDLSAALLLAFYTALIGPFNGLILRRDFEASPLHLSVLASANAACLLLSLGLARLIDSRRPLNAVVWTAFAARALFLLVPLIRSPWPFVGVLVGATMLNTVTSPAQAALIQQVYPREVRGRALGVVRVGGAIAGVALALVAGHLLGEAGFRLAFPVAALFGMAAALTLRRLPVPSVPEAAKPVRHTLREAWTAVREDAGFRGLLIASSVFGTGIWMMTPATPLVQVDVLRVTTAQVGMFAAVAGAVAIVANLLWGRLVDRRSSLTTLRTIYAMGTLTPIIYYLACTGLRTPWMLVPAAISESLLATGLDLVWMLVVIDFAGPRRTALYAAIGATLAGVRGVIGPLLGALLIEWWGLPVLYAVAAAFMATGAALATLHVRWIRNECAAAADQCAVAALGALRRIRLA